MSDARAIPTWAFREGLRRAATAVEAANENLCMLDAAAGDGDLGTTLTAGFSRVRATLDSNPSADPGRMLKETGLELARSAPSTIGTLLAGGFIRAAPVLDGVNELDAAHVAAMLRAVSTSVAERGGAQAGERTVLDAMEPAALAAAQVDAAGGDAFQALAAAAEAAETGAEATTQMEPRHGRAGWIQDRARGSKDAGAAAWAIYLTGLADGCQTPAPVV
jgi:dihydroxyacetone kinase-like protein